MNKVILIGRLTKDPELTFLNGTSTALTKITLAVPKYNSKTKKSEADFIPVQLWGKRAENTAKYTKKGSQVSISGRIQTGSYTAKDGTKRYTTTVVADDIMFISNKNEGSEKSEAPNGNKTSGAPESSGSPYNNDEDIMIISDEEMPF